MMAVRRLGGMNGWRNRISICEGRSTMRAAQYVGSRTRLGVENRKPLIRWVKTRAEMLLSWVVLSIKVEVREGKTPLLICESRIRVRRSLEVIRGVCMRKEWLRRSARARV